MPGVVVETVKSVTVTALRESEGWNVPNPMKKGRALRNALKFSPGETAERGVMRKSPDRSQVQVIASILARHQPRKGQGTRKRHTVIPSIPRSSGKTSNAESSKIIPSHPDPLKARRRRVNQSRPLQESSNSSKKILSRKCYAKKNWTSKSSAEQVANLLMSQAQTKNHQTVQKCFDHQRAMKKRKRKQKIEADQSCEDDMSRIKRRVKYLLTRMNVEQNYIDAYSADGWKGQSREKIRPEKELQRAKAQILRFQLGIRDAIHQLDALGLEGTMKEYIFDTEGRIYHEDIFCAKCKRQDSGEDNDIILCDGSCDRAFHQLCLAPPLKTDDIPPEDEGWLCPVCECKMECLDVVNAYLGTSYSMGDDWQNIFMEAAAFAAGDGKLADVDGLLPSDDSEDDDYNPEEDNWSKGKDNNADHQDSHSESTSDTNDEEDHSSDSNDENYSKGSLLEELAGIMESGIEDTDRSEGKNHMEDNVFIDEDGTVINEKRQRKEIDYKKLHDEMFGKSSLPEEVSEDDEWGPRKRMKRTRQSGQENLITSEKGDDGGAKPLSENRIKRSRVCLPAVAVEKLRAVFKENPLPSRACKEGLSKQLGLSFQKVHVWFRNVRAAALKKGLVEHSRSRGRHRSKTLSSRKSETGFHENDSDKTKERAAEDSWLTAMNMINEAQLKIDRIRLLLQDRTEIQDYGRLMYVAVAELKERISIRASTI